MVPPPLRVRVERGGADGRGAEKREEVMEESGSREWRRLGRKEMSTERKRCALPLVRWLT